MAETDGIKEELRDFEVNEEKLDTISHEPTHFTGK
jgi:hypothetical protein